MTTINPLQLVPKQHPRSLHQVEQRVSRISLSQGPLCLSQEKLEAIVNFRWRSPWPEGWEEVFPSRTCAWSTCRRGSSVGPDFLLRKIPAGGRDKEKPWTQPGWGEMEERRGGISFQVLPHPLIQPQKPLASQHGVKGHLQPRLQTLHTQSKWGWVGENSQIDGERH